MAIPLQLRSTLRPFRTLGRTISPTGIGVLLSIGAHAAIIAAAAQGSIGGSSGGLFDAFDEAAEEKVVPIVQLTPAERNRLPAFAQPRREPPGISSLDLPPGLLAPGTTSGQRRISVPAGRMPSPTVPRQFAATPPINDVLEQIKARVAAAPTRPQPPISIDIPRRTPTSAYIPSEPSVIVPPIGDINGGISAPSNNTGSGQSNGASGLPQLEARSTQDILDRLEGASNQSSTPGKTPSSSESENGESASASSGGNSQGNSDHIDIPVENSSSNQLTTLAPEPADGNPADLREDLAYDDRLTSAEAVAEKEDAWTESVASKRGTLPQAQAEVGINAAFKACRENPPSDALIGAIVSPGGEIETSDILRSTGYETLNQRAQEAVENYDFSSVETPTDYRITVKVNYDDNGCVDVEGLKERLTN